MPLFLPFSTGSNTSPDSVASASLYLNCYCKISCNQILFPSRLLSSFHSCPPPLLPLASSPVFQPLFFYYLQPLLTVPIPIFHQFPHLIPVSMPLHSALLSHFSPLLPSFSHGPLVHSTRHLTSSASIASALQSPSVTPRQATLNASLQTRI